MKHRAPAYWPTRVLLVAGTLGTTAVVLLAGAMTRMAESCFSCDYPDVLGLPSTVVGVGLGVALAVFGLVWMVRIFRGPRDEPPAWRHRDR